jgi:hypothetical protein
MKAAFYIILPIKKLTEKIILFLCGKIGKILGSCEMWNFNLKKKQKKIFKKRETFTVFN